MKVALVHDWLNGMRGGEKILEVLAEIFPEADIYTLLYEPEKISPVINKHNIRVSFLQKLPFVKKFYRYYLPIFPFAIERFSLSGYDLVISTSHCVAKGIKVKDNALHICYCLTPMRYVWDFSGEYFNLMRFAFWPVLSYLKAWDKKTSLGPNFYFTISHTVADRVKRYYNRDSIVIYPPVDTEFFVPKNAGKDYYLIVSALVPYKRIDLAVSAFTKMGLSLKIIGAGTDYNKLKKKAGPNIEFLGWQDNNTVRDYYAGCKAFIFPGVEDFGITVLEAQGCGRPVIAYFGGGARETINPDIPTGVFFREQTVESLENAVYEFEKNKNAFDKDKIRNHVLKFERELFKKRLTDEIQRLHSLYYNR